MAEKIFGDVTINLKIYGHIHDFATLFNKEDNSNLFASLMKKLFLKRELVLKERICSLNRANSFL